MRTFDYSHTVTMGDTNAMGNCYFLNYFKLQGHVRELWMQSHVKNYMEHASKLILSTKSAHCDFKIPFFLYDEIIVKLYFSEAQRVSVKINFDFYKKGCEEVCASGWQLIVCKNHDRKTCKFPPDFIEAFNEFFNK